MYVIMQTADKGKYFNIRRIDKCLNYLFAAKNLSVFVWLLDKEVGKHIVVTLCLNRGASRMAYSTRRYYNFKSNK